MVGFEFLGQALSGRQTLVGVGLGEDNPEAPVDGSGQLFGQMSIQIPSLMQGATLHLGRLAEHLLGARSERLGSVDDAQHTGAGIEIPSD